MYIKNIYIENMGAIKKFELSEIPENIKEKFQKYSPLFQFKKVLGVPNFDVIRF